MQTTQPRQPDLVAAVIRRVFVNRTRTPQEMLDVTGRDQYSDKDVLEVMPRGQGNEVEVFFFNFGYYATNADLEQEFDLRGFKPADPYSLIAANAADPVFAESHPNATHWKDTEGKWCFAACYRFRGRRVVSVHPYKETEWGEWGRNWWFAGIRK